MAANAPGAFLATLELAGSLNRHAQETLIAWMTGVPAFVRNGRLDILYANPLAASLYSEQFSDPVQPPNTARFVFLDTRARTARAPTPSLSQALPNTREEGIGRPPRDEAENLLVDEQTKTTERGHVLPIEREALGLQAEPSGENREERS